MTGDNRFLKFLQFLEFLTVMVLIFALSQGFIVKLWKSLFFYVTNYY